MSKYLISSDDAAMDVPEEDLPEVAEAAHAVMRDAQAAGVWVTGGGIAVHDVTVVDVDGSVTTLSRTAGVETHLEGFAVYDVPSDEEARHWAALTAAGCRCTQQVWPLMDDPEV